MGTLAGKTAVVTGGNRGIGRGIVERFTADGARVFACGRSALAEPFIGAAKGTTYRQVDVSKAADVAALFAAAKNELGRIDVLVNNAGILIERTIAEMSEAEWDQLIDINLKGVFLCSRAAIPLMAAQGGGSIINIGSISGFFADPKAAAYCASKAGVHMLTRGVALDHGREGIRCNAVCPGWIATDMLASMIQPTPEGEAVRKLALAAHPLPRIGEPKDIASMAAWLASDDSAWVTGQYFTIDGGLTARNHVVF
ncbi:MAG: SDR family oxidoreductase [Alphaproteobacteria bacterium]|nr:SDR family oxidoreductase [Alphaproteobacteria bacterium]